MTEESPKKESRFAGMFGAGLGAVSLVPNWTAAATLSLLGLAGGTAATVASWLAPILIGLAALALGRAHYVLYVLKRGNRFSMVTTWLATVLVIGFWTWKWMTWIEIRISK